MAGKPDVWMPLYVADYLADTGHLTVTEHGAYMLLIMHYWRNAGLPQEDAKLARIAKCTAREWALVRPTIAELFGPGWTHKRIDAELATANAAVERNRVNGRKGGRPKKQNPEETHCITQNKPSGYESDNPNHNPNERPSPSPSPSPVNTQSVSTTSPNSDTATNASRRGGEVKGIGLHEPDPNDPPFVQIMQAFDRERVLAFGELRARGWRAANDRSDAQRYLASGADLALCRDVFRAACQQLVSEGAEPPDTLKFMEKRIANALAARDRPMPQGQSKSGGFDPVAHMRALAEKEPSK